MNSKLKVLLSVVAMSFVIVGCGGGGGDSTSSNPPATPSVDNSALADGENQYGYYGSRVIFGSTEVVGLWNLKATISGVSQEIEFGLNADGTFYGFEEYGVSDDGTIMRNSFDDYTKIVQNLGGNCYTVSIDNAGDVLNDVKMCKISNDPNAGTIQNMSLGIQLQP